MNSSVLLCFSLLFIVSCGASHSEKWHRFKLQYDKTYDSLEEEEYRQRIFKDNLYKIVRHNLLYDLGFYTYKMGVNQFTDLTSAEFLRFYTTPIDAEELFRISNNSSLEVDEADDDIVDLPTSLDWRSRGLVTGVKNQKTCSSCWAFSTTGALEAQWAKRTGRLVPLSEQNLVDCVGFGCNPGDTVTATRYIIRNGGINTQASYPYEGVARSCRYNRAHIGARARNIDTFRGENQLKAKLATIGPISALIDAAPGFSSYSRGVYYDPNCGRSGNNHLVLVVGYGSERGHDYWLVKNSWGQRWGEGGYVKLLMNRNTCGLGTFFSYPTV